MMDTLPPSSALATHDGMESSNRLGKGDVFRSHDVMDKTQFGDYRVDGGVMRADGYNEFLGRMVKRISDSLSAPVTKSSKEFANISRFPFLQVNLPQLSAWVDEFIRRRLFAREFDPFADENWRLLCLDPVANHIIQTFGRKLPELAETETTAPPIIKQRRLSEVAKINVRESSSIVTPKSAPRENFPSSFVNRSLILLTVPFRSVWEQKLKPSSRDFCTSLTRPVDLADFLMKSNSDKSTDDGGTTATNTRPLSPKAAELLLDRAGNLPVWIRSPKTGTEFYSGISRAKLYELAGAGKITSRSIREVGQIKGTRLFLLSSILNFIASCDEGKPQSIAADEAAKTTTGETANA